MITTAKRKTNALEKGHLLHDTLRQNKRVMEETGSSQSSALIKLILKGFTLKQCDKQ